MRSLQPSSCSSLGPGFSSELLQELIFVISCCWCYIRYSFLLNIKCVWSVKKVSKKHRAVKWSSKLPQRLCEMHGCTYFGFPLKSQNRGVDGHRRTVNQLMGWKTHVPICTLRGLTQRETQGPHSGKGAKSHGMVQRLWGMR